MLSDRFGAALRELVIPKEVLEWLQDEVVQSDLTDRAPLEHARRRTMTEIERLENRIGVLSEDRLDGRITPEFFDQKDAESRDRQERLKRKICDHREAQLAPAKDVLDLMSLTSKAREPFLEQPT